jgi:hypothetical protein
MQLVLFSKSKSNGHYIAICVPFYSFYSVPTFLYHIKIICLIGSPFIVPVIDGSLAIASGPGLGSVPAHKATKFHVSVSSAGGDADLATHITGLLDVQFSAYS